MAAKRRCTGARDGRRSGSSAKSGKRHTWRAEPAGSQGGSGKGHFGSQD